MYNLFNNSKTSSLLKIELPALATADIIVEYFFKFGSFTLEVIAFLCTWAFISWLIANAVHKDKQ